MSGPSALDFLTSIWEDADQAPAPCCHCGQEIGPEDVLARTFILQESDSSGQAKSPEAIDIPTLGQVLQFRRRHAQCLFHSTSFVTISHVWPQHVADLQYRREVTSPFIEEVACVIREVPTRIAQGLLGEIPRTFEIWHDYISVPQWNDRQKRQIIKAIPEIFKHAKMTVAYLADIEEQSFLAMRTGNSQEERCRGMSELCHAKWFTRVWTTMEHTQSVNLRAMVKNFKLIEPDAEHRPFLVEMNKSWQNEVRKHGFGRVLEQIVGIYDRHLVPWQLGPINPVRCENLQGTPTCFAMAHILLSRRCLTIPGDFFLAIQGILKCQLTEKLSNVPEEALLQLAMHCLSEGDFSPLFMAPGSLKKSLDFFDHGYLDLETFSLGGQETPPSFPAVKFHHPTGKVGLQAEMIGKINFIRRFDWGQIDTVTTFAVLCRLALQTVGLKLEAFVATVGSRLYGQDLGTIQNRLSEEGRRSLLSGLLTQLYDTYVGDADDVNIASQIADIVGLSNRSLGEPYENPMTPMDFLIHHGGTMHHANSGAIVGVRCSFCHEVYLIRMSLFKPPSTLIGTRAYRIPGLRYHFSHVGGLGFLLQDNLIVGRFIWGTPTCDCDKLEEVDVIVRDIALPRPNNTRYGS